MFPDTAASYIDFFLAANPTTTEPELRDFLEGIGWEDAKVAEALIYFNTKKNKPSPVSASAPMQAPTLNVSVATGVAHISSPTPAVVQPENSVPAGAMAVAMPAPTQPLTPAPVSGANPFAPTPTIVATPMASSAPVVSSAPAAGIFPEGAAPSVQTMWPAANQGQVTFGLKPVPAFEGMPHANATSHVNPVSPSVTAVGGAVAGQVLAQNQPVIAPKPTYVQSPEIQPFNQAGFVTAPAAADTRFANGLRRVPEGMGVLDITAPQLTPQAYQNVPGGALNQEPLNPNVAALNTTPEAYAGYTQAPVHKHHALAWVIALFIFAATAGTVAAQFLGYSIIPRSFLSTIGLAPVYIEPSDFFKRIFTAAPHIESGTYSIALTAKAVNRDADDEPFKPLAAEGDSVMRKRDIERLNDATSIVMALSGVYAKSVSYPYTLDNLKVPTKDTMGNVYVYTRGANGDSFELSVRLESSDLIQTAATYYRVKDGAVIFTQNSMQPNRLTQVKVKPQSFFANAAIAELVPYADVNLDAGIRFSGTFDRNQTAGDLMLLISAYYRGEGINEHGQIEARKKDDMAFMRLAAIPDILVKVAGDTNLKGLEGKWVGGTLDEITSDPSFSWVADLGKTARDTNSTTTKSQKDSEQAQMYGKQVAYIVKEYGDQNMLRYRTTPKQESIKGVTAYRYDLTFDYSRLASFLESVKTKLDADYGDRSIVRDVSPSTIEYLRSDAFLNEARYFEDHSTFAVWITPQDQVVNVETSVEYIPDASATSRAGKWKAKKAVVAFTAEIEDMNKPIVVEKPKDYLSIGDYKKLYWGVTDQELVLLDQMEHVSKIKNALMWYKLNSKTIPAQYPAKLEQLLVDKSDLRGINVDESDLIDLYTKKQFTYRVTEKGANYEIGAQIQLPERVTSKKVLGTITRGVYLATTKKTNSIYSMMITDLQVVNGLNTFTAKDAISVQRKKVGSKDTDGDGYSDALEKLMGRNSLKADVNTGVVSPLSW